MPSTFALAPSFKWYFFDAEGRPATGGTIKTFYNTNKTQERPVYSDPSGLFPYANPIGLDSNGGTPVPMYWENDGSTLYYVEVYDNQGRLINSIDDYPIDGAGGATPVTNNTDIENFISNGGFQLIDQSFKNVMPFSNAPTGEFKIAPGGGSYRENENLFTNSLGSKNVGWYFIKEGGSGVVDSIEFVAPGIGTTPPLSPANNPRYYFQYNATGAGAAITTLRIAYIIPHVRNFSGETVNISFDAMASSGTHTSDVGVIQDFGSGGGSISAAVSTTTTFTWPSDWTARVSHDIAIPSVNGKNLGTDGNDRLLIIIDIPPNALGSDFRITNVQMQLAANKTDFIYEPYQISQYRSVMDLLQSAIPPPGAVRFSISDVPAAGWIVHTAVNNTIGNPSSGATTSSYETRALFIILYERYPNSVCPVSGGRTGSTEADAITDYNNSKFIQLPPFLGRVIGAGGQGSGLSNRNFNSIDGLESVVLTEAQMPSHAHDVAWTPAAILNPGPAVTASAVENYPSDRANSTSSKGSNQPHDNVQPTHFLYLHIKL